MTTENVSNNVGTKYTYAIHLGLYNTLIHM